MLEGKYQQLYGSLRKVLTPRYLLHDELSLLAYGTDASFYRLLPKLVIKVDTEEEVLTVFKGCKALRLPLTIRAAGTSLSGQSISDSVLMVLDHGWKKMEILEGGAKIKLQPGVIGGDANRALLPYGRRIGPDPASIDAAMIGGIAANNAGGMCCGTEQNSYHTLAAMRIILMDGAILDTQDPASITAFRHSHASMLQKISLLRDQILAQPLLADRISAKYKMKNTMGYSLNALVDFDEPINILQHLMIGSEGTLGFISDLTYHTVPEYADKASALMIFKDIETACKVVDILKAKPVEAVELMDRAALRSVEAEEGMPSYLKELDERAAALLVETRAANDRQLTEKIEEITAALKYFPSLLPIAFTKKVAEYAKFWNIRNGLFPSIGAMRESGTTVIMEDVAFPVPKLAAATGELQALFTKHGYPDAIIYGHSLAGNLHFVFKQNFNIAAEVERYRRFMDDVTEMVVKKYDGALKAEHGIGRNMAPYLEFEWGAEAVRIMREIKEIFDPDFLLNPGVVLNDDAEIHIKNLKPLPVAHELINKCIECGFCEAHCVSNHMTLSARQRIASYREIARLRRSGENPKRLKALQRQFRYHGEQTCATDGLCALACPVSIDTGQMIKALRHDHAGSLGKRIAGLISRNMTRVTAEARIALRVVEVAHRLLGTKIMSGLTKGLQALSYGTIPHWNPYMPGGAKRIRATAVRQKSPLRVVYFASCITRAMGPARLDHEKVGLVQKTEALLHKGGFEIIYPANLDELCCGMAFASKGFKETGNRKAMELQQALFQVTNNGEYPVLCDMSPCLYHMKETLDQRLKLYEPIEFTLKYLAPRLKFNKLDITITVYPVCSAKIMGLEGKLVQLAQMCAERVIVPQTTCCGFAGDRGFTHPELNAHALRHLKEQIPDDCRHGYSTSRTCEIGLSLHSGILFQSILYLVDQVTTAL
ncbi:MAG: FAD-binding and (Fe-S)-binding domain-containing protein [Candidatus Aminicenantales bacterium]